MAFDKKSYTKQYNNEKYDEIKIRVPKGDKERIKLYVDKYDLVSVGAYINMLIAQDMQKRAEEEVLEEVLDQEEDT